MVQIQLTKLDYACTRYYLDSRFSKFICRLELEVYWFLLSNFRVISFFFIWSHQQAVAGISHISFGEDGTVSPKKPASLPEVAKQRELSGTLDSEAEAKLKKQLSEAKCKELSGHNIFAPPPEIQPRPLAARALALRESITIGEAVPNQVSPSFSSVYGIIWVCLLRTGDILRFTY